MSFPVDIVFMCPPRPFLCFLFLELLPIFTIFIKSMRLKCFSLYHVIPDMINKIRLQTKHQQLCVDSFEKTNFTLITFTSDRDKVNQFDFMDNFLTI